MRLLAVILSIFLALPAFAQTGQTDPGQAVIQGILQSAAVANGNGSTLNTSNNESGFQIVTFIVSGSFSATVNPEGTQDGSNWQALFCLPVVGGSGSTTFTAAGGWRCNLAGSFNQVRARISGYANGSVTVTGISSSVGTVANAPYPVGPGTTGTSPILYVSSFGVQCDGVTDDTQAFKNLASIIRFTNSATVIFPASSTCLVWSSGGVGGDVLFDLSNTNDVQFYGNSSTVLAGNVNSLITTAFDLNASTNTLIDGLIFRSGYASLDPHQGVDWIIARQGANAIVLSNLTCTYGQICFAAKGEMAGQGGDASRVRNITVTNMVCTTVYYCLNFQSAGDDFYARGITGRNCGRTYFPWNVRNHDVWIDSEQGGPFTDVLLKVYTQSGMYSRLENIKLVYWSDGRYPGSGDQNTDEAMIALEFQLNDANNLPGMIQNIDITLNVEAGSSDKNQSILAIRKLDLNGNADTIGRGHQLSAVTIRGMSRSLFNLITDAFRLFTRLPDNWTGDVVSSLTLENLSITGATTAVNINGQGLSMNGATLRNIDSDGLLIQTDTAGRPFYTSQAYFSNLAAGMLMD